MVIGIDLAWTATGNTGLCALSPDGQLKYLPSQAFSFQEMTSVIRNWTGGQIPTTIAIDAPLVILNETGSRPAEQALKKTRFAAGHIAVFASNRLFFERYGPLRADGLLQHWRGLKWPVSLAPQPVGWCIETYPRGVLAALFPGLTQLKYKGTANAAARRQGLVDLQAALTAYCLTQGWHWAAESPLCVQIPEGRAQQLALADDLDAVLCVIAGHHAQAHEYQVFPKDHTDWGAGAIVLPQNA
jgi:predicted RNase H-like nuclease